MIISNLKSEVNFVKKIANFLLILWGGRDTITAEEKQSIVSLLKRQKMPVYNKSAYFSLPHIQKEPDRLSIRFFPFDSTLFGAEIYPQNVS